MIRFFCRLLGHRPPPGHNPQWCFAFWCERCHTMVKGELQR